LSATSALCRKNATARGSAGASGYSAAPGDGTAVRLSSQYKEGKRAGKADLALADGWAVVGRPGAKVARVGTQHPVEGVRDLPAGAAGKARPRLVIWAHGGPS